MKKLLTIIVIIMTIAAVAVVARAGDDFDLKKKVEFQNTIYIIGVADTSLTRSNEADALEEVACNNLYTDGFQSSYFYRENGGMGYRGIVMADEFRAGVKLADILFFADTIKLKVALNQRLITYIEDLGAAAASSTGGGDIFANINLYFQYRSYLDMTMEFGNDVVKYTLNPYIQMRMIFDGQAGIESVRQYTYLGHKIAITKILEIQQSTEYMVRWTARYTTVPGPNVDSTLSLDLRLGSPGLAGGGAHYLNAFARRANGYDIGPISLSWLLRLSLDLDMNNSRWKDTDPGSALAGDEINSDYGTNGIMKAWKFRMRYAEVWVNPLKTMKLIGLNIGVSDYLELNANWAYNNPYTIKIINELKVGAELVLDKAFVVGLFLKMRTTDYANAWGVPLNGSMSAPAAEQWNNNDAAITEIIKNGEEYQTIPNGNGLIGPNIYVGVSKGAFEWMFGWQGWTSFRDYDMSRGAGDYDYIETKYLAGDPNMQNYFSWRNELESWVTWKW